MRILLVDDDEGFRATLLGLLTQRGRPVQVEEAADGEAALRMAANRRPDAVLMDLTMPRLNGLEATRQLKTRWPDVPVIILTVHDDPVYQRTARAARADGFLLKKTAGTALWPALLRLVPSGGATGSGPAGPWPAGQARRRPGAPAGEVGEIPAGGSGIYLIGGSSWSRYSTGEKGTMSKDPEREGSGR